MIAKQLLILAASILGASSHLASTGVPLAALADSGDGKFTTTEVIVGSSFNYGSIGWQDEEHTLAPTSEAYPGAKEYNLFRDVKATGASLFGDGIASLFADDEARTRTLNSFHIDKTNLNLYADANSSAKVVISYDMQIFSILQDLATAARQTFVVPALMMGDEVSAVFSVSATEMSLITPNDLVKSVSQTYSVVSVVDRYQSSGEPVTHQTYNTDIAFEFKKGAVTHVEEVSTISYGDFETEQDSLYAFDYDKGYVASGFRMVVPSALKEKVYSLPYEITYFDYEEGVVSLGHSAYGERYGSSLHQEYLKSVEMTVYSGGKNVDSTLRAMTANEYVAWRDNGTKFNNRFAYLSRQRMDDEIGGEGSLIHAYYAPNPTYSIDASSYITVKKMTFFEPRSAGESLPYAPDGVEEISFSLPSNAVRFKYYFEEATERCTYEFKGVNISDDLISEVKYDAWDWRRWIIGFLSLGISEVSLAITPAIANMLADGKLNIQRFYFNLTDTENQLIENVFKIDFRYQEGRKEVNVDSDGVFVDTPAEPWPDLDPLYAVAEVGDAKKDTRFDIGTAMATMTLKTDGFVSIEETPQSVAGIEYSYYYQNVYETTNFSDFMCWWEPLSIWHKTEEGKTVRATTTEDGTYAVKDPDGNYVIMSLDNPGEPLDITMDEWLDTVKTNGTNHGIEPGSSRTPANPIDDFPGWWDGTVAPTLDRWKAVIGIALGAVGAVLLVFIIAKIVGGSKGKTVVNVHTDSKPKGGKRKGK